MGEKNGNTFKLPMEKIIKNYSTFMDPDTAAISLYIQHWGNGGTGACIKSAKLLISDEPPPFDSVTDITLPGAGGSFGYKDEFKLAATLTPSFASKQKILWSIRKWVSKDGKTTYDLDAKDDFATRQGIKSKVDFKTTFNENDDPIYGRDTLIATGGIGSAGTVTLVATIKDAVLDEGTGKTSDFTKPFTVNIIDVINYIVPASGYGFFYVDLNDWKTASPSGINANVPMAETNETSITVPFTENAQRINFQFTPAQFGLLPTHTVPSNPSMAQVIKIEIDGEVTVGKDTAGDKFRYHLGEATFGGAWNATGGKGDDKFASILTAELKVENGNHGGLGDDTTKLAQPRFLILQHRDDAAATVVIKSIKVTYNSSPTFKVSVGGTDQDVTVKASGPQIGGIAGAVDTTTGATLEGYRTVFKGGYGNSYSTFKVNFGSDTLASFTKMEFDFVGVLGDTGWKDIRVWAFDAEKSDYLDSNKGTAGQIINVEYKNNGLTPINVSEAPDGTLPTGNEVWFIITIHAGATGKPSDSDVDLTGATTFQVSGIKFVK